MRAVSMRRVDWTGWGLILLVVVSLIALFMFHGGCVSQGEPFRGNGHNVYPDGDSASPALGGLLSRLSVLSWICLVVGVIGVAASFYGPLKAFIDSKVAIIVVGIGVALPVLAALIEPLAEHVTAFRWVVGGLLIVGGVLAAWPWFQGIKNYITGTRCLGCPAAVDGKPPVVAAAPAEVKP